MSYPAATDVAAPPGPPIHSSSAQVTVDNVDDDYEYSNDDSNDDDDDDTFSISSSEDLTTEVEDLKRDASSKKFSPSADEASAAPASVLTFRNICYSVSVKQRKGEPSTVGPQFTRQDSTLANFAGLPPQPGIQEPPVSAAAAVQADGGATGGGGIADGFRRKRVRRQILTGVNGEARSGEVTAIMGASGGGKTTLLNILAQRISSGRRRGTVELDAAEVCAGTMRRVSAYVMQDDVLFPSLTVRETLMYAAELRLEPRFSRREKEEKVARLIDMLGLAKVENSPIGGETKRGVSGGERKRVAIGVEMVSDPKILFLDEPTSGLDSTSAYRVVRAMKSVAIQTTSICMMVIHQPSYRVLCVIDKLLLLGVGQTAYLGPPAGLPHFLASLGSPVPEGSNSTEHGLDVMAVLQAQGVTDIQAYAQACQEGVADPVAAAQKPLEAPHDTVDPKSSKEMSACGRVGNEEETKGREFANGWFRELWVLTRRATTNIMRTPALYLLRLALILIAGLLLAILFWRPAETPEGLIIRLSFLSCACCIVFFTSCDAVPIFIEESAIFVRESANNAYRPSTYLVSSTLVYLPLHFLMALLLTAVSWWSISLAGGAEGFLFMVVAFFVMFFTANAIATCVSICVKEPSPCYLNATDSFQNLPGNTPTVPTSLSNSLGIPPSPPGGSPIPTPEQLQTQLLSTTLFTNPLRESALSGLSPEARAMVESGGAGAGGCLLTGPQLLANRALDQLGKWECLSVLLVIGLAVKLITLLLLVRLRQAKQK
ncbi:unnamed protein product [Closterium sp. NIES-54]